MNETTTLLDEKLEQTARVGLNFLKEAYLMDELLKTLLARSTRNSQELLGICRDDYDQAGKALRNQVVKRPDWFQVRSGIAVTLDNLSEEKTLPARTMNYLLEAVSHAYYLIIVDGEDYLTADRDKELITHLWDRVRETHSQIKALKAEAYPIALALAGNWDKSLEELVIAVRDICDQS